MEGQAKTDATLPPGTKIKPIDQEVQQNELMTTDEKLIDDPVGIALPDQAQTQNVSIPEPFDPATYGAAEAAPKVGAATVATGRPSEEAVMEAAQGQISPESLLPLPLLKNLILVQPLAISLRNCSKVLKRAVLLLRGLHLQFDRSEQSCNSVVWVRHQWLLLLPCKL